MESEYDISHCAARVGLVSLRLHTKSRIVPERCSEPVFSPIPIGVMGEERRREGEEKSGATRRHRSTRFLDDDFDLRELRSANIIITRITQSTRSTWIDSR